MSRYKVEATFTHRGVIEVEAESESKAWDIAENTDGGEFKEVFGSGSCEIHRPEKLPDVKEAWKVRIERLIDESTSIRDAACDIVNYLEEKGFEFKD